MPGLAFLHTSPVHIATFDRLRDELRPGLKLRHLVDETLLEDARRMSVEDLDITARVHAAMAHAASGGADLVVCTCSTIGGVAEAMDTQGRFMAARIDRAMADEAARHGPRILIAAALESTLQPTQTLVQDSARRLETHIEALPCFIPEAWTHFLAGRTAAYHRAIADALLGKTAAIDVIVLAQASMAGAGLMLEHLNIPVLSSPRLGFLAALQRLSSASFIT